ncbi:geranylgeranylglycerol-phosphate geranylgeranyltransferase [Aquimarina sp. RZ0]|uniref:geranylgeranylglycerol-phosphate geranylgeranyltransferase n=1 Tax=Aquimarina sp. RZ0 TaxID=2607730 RepID=UPI0011F37D84|nr:geranylgeranylglycerol-phosphate geranylgeranyltransferase [Aquimarina sp. RZ0]KAA1244710.1 prenyltransferase [Aquimarina sp. RZ0]
MYPFLKLIKFDNLFLIAIAQLCVKYGLFDPFGIDITLNGFGITLLVLSTICITAAGNIGIEIYTSEHTNGLLNGVISEKAANLWFIIFNVIGVLIGFYMSNLIGRPGFVALFIIISGVFYIYASYLKEIIILKNLIIGVLIALSLIVIPIFDLLPAITDKNRASQTVFFSIVMDYAIFAFIITVIREITKDCITMDKDHNAGLNTIPITLGKDRTVKLISGLIIIPLGFVIYYIYTYLFSNTIAVISVLGFIIAPLLLFMFKSWNAETNKHFNILSVILKIVLFTASLSLLLYQFILK